LKEFEKAEAKLASAGLFDFLKKTNLIDSKNFSRDEFIIFIFFGMIKI
jgi:hypothetical protein